MNSSRKRPLNIGLGKMLSQVAVATSEPAPEPMLSAAVGSDTLRQIALECIQPGQYQPRQNFDGPALQELADSIREQGVIQPIVLRQIKPQQYEILAGERRWRASQLAGLEKIPAVIKEISDEAALAIALIENIQREDLNALEEARALHRLLEEFQMTHEAVAKAVGKSRTMVTNLLRLLQLDEQVKTFLEHGDLDMGHARALLSLSPMQQRELAKEIVNKKLSVRETESLVKRYVAAEPNKKTKPSHSLDANLLSLQRDLSERLGTKVNFMHVRSGKGKLVIEYANLDVLEGILSKISV